MTVRKSPHLKVRSDSSLLKNAKEGALAAAAGNLFHTSIDFGGKKAKCL